MAATREDALQDCPQWNTEEGKAIRFALGSDQPPSNEELWLIAARSFQPDRSLQNPPTNPTITGPGGWDSGEVTREFKPAEDITIMTSGGLVPFTREYSNREEVDHWVMLLCGWE